MCSIPIKMILATDIGYGIGVNNKLPNWRLKGDMAQFKRLTIGKGDNFVIMGGNTWASMDNRPLIKRRNIVLSKTVKTVATNQKKENVIIARDLNDAFQYIDTNKSATSELWVIGGAQIYEWFMPYVCEIHWTRALKDYQCTTFLSKEQIKMMITKVWSTEYSEHESHDSDGYIYCTWKSDESKKLRLETILR